MGQGKSTEILLIQPPLPANGRHKRVLPLSLAYLASYLRKYEKDLSIEILDALVLDMKFKAVLREIKKKKRDVIGITFWSTQAPFAYALSKAIRKQRLASTIVFGGAHTTTLPQEASRFADYCALHEGEETFKELIDYIRGEGGFEHAIQGLAYRHNGEFFINKERPFIKDLDSIPFPAWDLLPIERYDTALHVVGGRRIPVVGSRGCCYNCSYCVSPFLWKRQVRWRSPVNVISEMKEVIARYGIKQFHFWDDNLLMSKRYVKELCEMIIDQKLDIKWVGLSRGSHIAAYPEITKLLKESGCVGLEIGIESADEHTLKNTQKGEQLRILKQASGLQKQAGLYPLYTYMSLNPGETIDTYYFQARFIDELLYDLPWCDFFHPLPFPVYIGQFCTPHVGTQLFDKAKELGIQLADSWAEFNHHTVNFLPHSLLQDIPQKNIERLRDIDYIICTKAAWGWIYELYPCAEGHYRQIAKRCGFLRFVREFFTCCNGKRNIQQIAKRVSFRLGIRFKKSLQYAAVTTIVLAQLGVIHSARNTTEDITVKKIILPDEKQAKKRYRILRLLSFLIAEY